jgi:hypothetical protein
VPAAPAGIRRAEVGPGGQAEGVHAVGGARGRALMLLLLLVMLYDFNIDRRWATRYSCI